MTPFGAGFVTGTARFTIDVDVGALEAAAQRLRTVAAGVQEVRTHLTTVPGALEGAWSGQAHDATVAEIQGLTDLMARFEPMLARAEQAVREVAATAEQARTRGQVLSRRLEDAREERDTVLRATAAGTADPLTADARAEDAREEYTRQSHTLTREFETLTDDLRAAFTRLARTLTGCVPAHTAPGTASGAWNDAVLDLLGGLALTAREVADRDLWEAVDLAALLTDPARTTTAEQWTRLRELLAHYGDDPAFATALLAQVGPRGFLSLAGQGLAARDLGLATDAQTGALQRALGRVLATGTRHWDGTGELPGTWIAELMAAGRAHVTIHGTLSSNDRFYGYQLLGVLLPHGRFGEEFLVAVGTDMLAFERSGGGGRAFSADSLIWSGTLSVAVNPRLDHTGTRPDAPLGYDPVRGLMLALAHAPDAGRELLTSPGVGGRPWVDYLLTDRPWTIDVLAGGATDPSKVTAPNPGIDALGDALLAATTQEPDLRSWTLVNQMVQAVSTDEQAKGLPNAKPDAPVSTVFGATDLVYPQLRPVLGQITAAYIPGFHWSHTNAACQTVSPLLGDVGSTLKMSERDMLWFLADVAKDPQAATVIRAAEAVYVQETYPAWVDHDIANHDTSQAWSLITSPMTDILATVDYGEVAFHRAHAIDQDVAASQPPDALGYKIAGEAVNAATQRLPFIASETIGAGMDKLVSEASKPIWHDSSGEVNYEESSITGEGKQRVSRLISRAVYPALPESTVQEIFQQDGSVSRMEDWTEGQQIFWDNRVSNLPTGSALQDIIQQSQESYATRMGEVGDSLEKIPSNTRH